MKRFFQDSKARFIDKFSKSYDEGSELLISNFGHSNDQIPVQNTKNLEYLDENTNDRIQTLTESEFVQARFSTEDTTHLQPNAADLEDLNSLKPEIMLGFTNKTNFLIGC